MTAANLSQPLNICSVDDCNKKPYAFALCPKHYTRLRRHGSTDLPIRDTQCSVAGCETRKYGHGYCLKHYTRNKNHGDPLKFAEGWGEGETFEDRFWSRVNKNGSMHPTDPSLGRCWEWLGSTDTAGYGSVYYEGKLTGTHRVSWLLICGLPATQFLLHSCDNPPCCNPKHLREGTQRDNVQDSLTRSRRPQNRSNADTEAA